MTASLAPTHPSAVSPDTTVILDAIDAAVAEHMDWLQAWHRALFCRDAMPQDVLSPNAHLLCGFGAWLARRRDAGGLIDQPAFDELEEAHRRMHHQARFLAGIVERGEHVPPREYDGLIEAVNEFNAHARRIASAFRRLLSDLDPLTGAHNRQAMLDELERERARAERAGTRLCVALADLDHFKRVNDTFGHAAGDRVLHVAAGRLLASVRPYDTVFRYGGEEFLLCLPNADLATAAAICERLRAALAETPVELEDLRWVPVTASFGVAAFEPGTGVREAIMSADRALYAAKEAGRDRVMAAVD
ncbi:MAG: diguanylate cyclase [Alphaproteobacteria bacterium]|nr:diguanylate cyclase [Alphaproteobacteria bacterium]